MSETKWVRYTLDPDNLPPLTAEQTAQLEALSDWPDEAIDYSDSPPLDGAVWKSAVDGPFFRPIKKQLTLRLDADLIDWFKHDAGGEGGKARGYQTRINRALREYVTAQRKKAG